MKILIATGIFVPEIGGPATYAYKISKEFLAMGHKVEVLTYSKENKEEFDKNLNYKVTRVKRTSKIKNYINYYKQAKKMIATSSYDVIYCFDHFSAGIPTILANKKFKSKIVIRVGGDFIWERYIQNTKDLVTLRQFYERNLHLSAEKLRFKIIKWVFNKSDKIIFTTEFQRDIFIKAYGFSLNKTDIIHNPIDQHKYKLDQASGNRDIIFLGRFIHKNNIFFLIDAFNKMRDKSFNLYLIGAGPLEQELKKYIQAMDNVKIIPKLRGKKLLNKLKSGYLVIFPSLTDISPNTLLECLNYNIPFTNTTEIGFEWLTNKAKEFNPQNQDELISILDKLSHKEEYIEYQKKLTTINYSYNYKQATQDTIKIFNSL